MIYLIPNDSEDPIEVPKELYDEIGFISDLEKDGNFNIPIDLSKELVYFIINYREDHDISSMDFDSYFDILQVVIFLRYSVLEIEISTKILELFDRVGSRNVIEEKRRLLRIGPALISIINAATIKQLFELIKYEDDEYVIENINKQAKQDFYINLPDNHINTDITIHEFLFKAFPFGMLYFTKHRVSLKELKEYYPELTLILIIFNNIFMESEPIIANEMEKFTLEIRDVIRHGEMAIVEDYHYLDILLSDNFMCNGLRICKSSDTTINSLLFPPNYLIFTILLLEFPEGLEWIDTLRYILYHLSITDIEDEVEEFYNIYDESAAESIERAPVYDLKYGRTPIIGLDKKDIDQDLVDGNKVYMKIGDDFYFHTQDEYVGKRELYLQNEEETYKENSLDFGTMESYSDIDILPDELPVEIIYTYFTLLRFENNNIYSYRDSFGNISVEKIATGVKNYWFGWTDSLFDLGNNEYIYYHGFKGENIFKFISPREINSFDAKHFMFVPVLRFEDGIAIPNFDEDPPRIIFYRNIENTFDLEEYNFNNADYEITENSGNVFHESELIRKYK